MMNSKQGNSLNHPIHPRTFGQLAIGDTFDCIGPNRFNSFFQTCKKISARKYTDGKFTYRIGSIRAEIFHVNENPVATVQFVKPKYRGMVTLHSDGWLLGGTRKHASIEFDTFANAYDWAQVVADTNRNRDEYRNADIRAQVVDTDGKVVIGVNPDGTPVY